MFENLTNRFHHVIKKITGKGRFKEENIKEALREVRESLLEADVALSVVKEFIRTVQEKAIGQVVPPHLSPAQAFIQIVHDELVILMGETNACLTLNTTPPAVILMAGLQGSGKTTTVAKLAHWLKETHKKSVAVVSADVYRPAAIEQLKTLAKEINVSFIESQAHESPVKIVKEAILQAKKSYQDVLIIDTAGRLHIDKPMMDEMRALYTAADPIEILFVVDSMTGQDAVNTAKAFNDALPLTGVILTKTEGDARGGAALSIRKVTGKPIKFIGVGEKISALEAFHPERAASRILGMGDVMSLIEEVERKVDKEKAQKLAKKLQKGQGFDLNDLRDQMKQMLNLGGMATLLDKLPGMGTLPQAVKGKVNDKTLIRSVAILDSMTQSERHFPESVARSGARKRRIAEGSGTKVQDINQVLKQHEQMQKNDAKDGWERGPTSVDEQLARSTPSRRFAPLLKALPIFSINTRCFSNSPLPLRGRGCPPKL